MIWYECPECHVKCPTAVLCWNCGVGMPEPYEAGATLRTTGPPNILGDDLPKHFDPACNAVITSRTQRKSLYKAMGLRYECDRIRRRHDDTNTSPHMGAIYSFPGQKHHHANKDYREH